MSRPTLSRAADPGRVSTSVEGFAFPGARPLGCLLIHGFTGSPWEMRPLGEVLAARGFPARGVRLAGHGTDPGDLAGTRWPDWYASASEGLVRLAGEAPRRALVGLSMGALLALRLAVSRPAEVDALVLCATPLRLGDARARWLPALSRLPPVWRWIARRYGMIPKPLGSDITDPVARAASPSYKISPIVGVLEVLRLQAVVRRDLARVTQPVLLLHGRHDRSVPLENLDLLRRQLGSRRVESHVLERSGHVLTVDLDREEVARLVGDFLEGA
jgi:carboxylesterase